MKVVWPVFRSHDEVVCWSCKKRIKGDEPAPRYTPSYASGCGQYNKRCQCGVVTWYDILNQCDGCRRGLRLEGGIHYGKSRWDMIGCTKSLYIC